MKVLIIEDNPEERMLERTILENAGYEVSEADNAKDGVKVAKKERPDLIIMDIRLPYKSKGIGAAKILRKTKGTEDIPIIFVTAYPVWEHSREIINIKNCGYLTKHFEPADLVKYIQQFLK